MDVNRALRTVVLTGKAHIGAEQAKKAAKSGKAKMFVVAKNIEKEELEMLKKLTKAPIYNYEGSNIELGAACGKPFAISTLTIIEPGESNILSLIA